MAAHAELAQEVGMYPENIYIVKRGDVMVLGKMVSTMEGSVPAGDVMIDSMLSVMSIMVMLLTVKSCQKMVSSSLP